MLGDWVGRRLAYTILCLSATVSTYLFFNFNDHVGLQFLSMMFLVGGLSASFYGWLPLYLPELFRTSVCATGQGFGFNFGRVLAAIGVLQFGNLMDLFRRAGEGEATLAPCAASVLCLIYVVGVGIIWLWPPETCRGKPLPD